MVTVSMSTPCCGEYAGTVWRKHKERQTWEMLWYLEIQEKFVIANRNDIRRGLKVDEVRVLLLLFLYIAFQSYVTALG